MEPFLSSLNTQHRLLVHLPVLFFSLFSLSFFHYLSLSFYLSLYLFSFSLSLTISLSLFLYVRVKESKRNRIDSLPSCCLFFSICDTLILFTITISNIWHNCFEVRQDKLSCLQIWTSIASRTMALQIFGWVRGGISWSLNWKQSSPKKNFCFQRFN